MSSTALTELLSTQTHDHRVAFAEELIAQAELDDRVVAVCNDSVGSSKLGEFQRRFPDRLVNVGIAEQNLVGVGAGLASAGFVPFVCAASPFLTGRSLEQIKADVAYSGHPVILCGMSPGVAYGALGPTHHSIEDLSWLRALPGLDIVVPADRAQTRDVVIDAVAHPRPMFIRVGRTKVPDLVGVSTPFERGRLQPIVDDPAAEVALVGLGATLSLAIDAAERLRTHGVRAAVHNAGYVSPMPSESLRDLAGHRSVIVIGEANVAGGVGAMVATALAELPDSPVMRFIGFRDFAPTGESEVIFVAAGLTVDNIVEQTLEAVGG